ncbi:MAG: conjugal transfer protein [Bacteroidetes bacterium]|nr:conjugal transfer protein [Bacteroidota bacterium]
MGTSDFDSSLFNPIDQVLSDENGRGLIIGKTGTLTYIVKLTVPEAYSLYKNNIESRHSTFVQAFSHMPENSYVHKQDMYIKEKYYPETPGKGFIEKAESKHFSGREYLKHICYIGFSIEGMKALSAGFTQKPFSVYTEKINKEDRNRLIDFLDAIEFALNNIQSLCDTEVSFLNENEIRNYVLSTVNFQDTECLNDLNFEQEILCGKNRARIFAITDNELLPDGDLPIYKIDNSVSQERSELYMSVGENIGGIHLNCNHIYNQVLFFSSDKKLKDQLGVSKNQYKTNAGWDSSLGIKGEELEALEGNLLKENLLLCHAYYSVVLWDQDPVALDMAEKDFRSKINVLNIKYYSPSHENLATLFGAGIIGATSVLNRSYMFVTTLNLAVCFFAHYSNFKDDNEGLLFSDRLYQIPLRKDIWDAKNKRVKARNSIVIAPTGSGKSFSVNNIVYQLLDQGYTVVAVEFGNSFKQLCYLYNDISLHVEYDQSMPLGINPFDLEGLPYNGDKEETIINLCLRFWRRQADNNEIVALRKFVKSYYESKTEGHSFEDFYYYIKDNFANLCLTLNINKSYFDYESFVHVCSEFVGSGGYANLCALTGAGSSIKDKRFIHFELTKVKNNPFVTSVVMSMLFDVINNKILSDPSKRGYIIFDEYAETAQIKSASALDVNIHQTVAFFYQKIRKENGAVMTIIQSPVQLPDNEYTKGIIANTQILYVLEGNEGVYDDIKKTFTIKNEAHFNQMRSLKNNYSAKRPYSECFIRFGETYALTVRIEASERKYLAFQTQGEIRAALDKMYSENHNMEECIEYYIENNPKK